MPSLEVGYIEGLRGLAALLVVLHHALRHTLAYASIDASQQLARDVLAWALQGRASVAVFIVLSGYLLMLPAYAAGGRMPRGVGPYLLRRARRILPPYYAALLFIVLALAAFPALRRPISVEWASSQPALSALSLIAHALLVHNLSADTALKIDPPMWTIATEWQLYFVFPFILLPLWRWMGGVLTVVVSLAATLTFVALTGRGVSAAPWFTGLFAMRMTAATSQCADADRDRRVTTAGYAALAVIGVYLAVTAGCSFTLWRDAGGFQNQYRYFWAYDIAVGLATACGLVYLTACGSTSIVCRVLSSRPLVRLGIISYSLYLIHDPLLAASVAMLRSLGWTAFGNFFALVGIGVPVVIAVAAVFHRCFEQPFLSRGAAARVRTEQADRPL